ncbi:1476_t:CDS:1, partial [Gigaspora margarita]
MTQPYASEPAYIPRRPKQSLAEIEPIYQRINQQKHPDVQVYTQKVLCIFTRSNKTAPSTSL